MLVSSTMLNAIPTTSMTQLQQFKIEGNQNLISGIIDFKYGSQFPLWDTERQFTSKSTSLVIEIESLLKFLLQEVSLKNLDKIREYLLQFPDIIDLIPRAIAAVKKHFPEAQLVMDLYADPEIKDCYLVLYIRLNEYDDSFIDRLEEAEAEFLDDLGGKEGWFQLSTDFRRPGEESVV